MLLSLSVVKIRIFEHQKFIVHFPVLLNLVLMTVFIRIMLHGCYIRDAFWYEKLNVWSGLNVHREGEVLLSRRRSAPLVCVLKMTLPLPKQEGHPDPLLRTFVKIVSTCIN